MKNVHLVIADLFLPEDFGASAGLRLPALEKILARGVPSNAAPAVRVPLEDALCGLFAIPPGVAAISAAFDGLERGCWMRADPVHVRLQREQVVMLPNVSVGAEEAALFCSSLNGHFADQGIEFFAPHPQRWYVRLDALPGITTVPLSQAGGSNIRGNLPTGPDARRWHQLFNEIQMLLFAHPLNEAREARGELPVNSVWFWGGSCGPGIDVAASFQRVSSDEVLAEMLAARAGTSFVPWQPAWHNKAEDELLVWTGLRRALQRGDLAAWRESLQDFETGYARPLWQALRSGEIARLELGVLGGDGVWKTALTRDDAWAFWRKTRRIADYSVTGGN